MTAFAALGGVLWLFWAGLAVLATTPEGAIVRGGIGLLALAVGLLALALWAVGLAAVGGTLGGVLGD